MTSPTRDDAEQVRVSLRDVVRDYGPTGLDDPELLGRLLPDLLAGQPRETKLVQAAASLGTARLLSERVVQGLPIESAISDVAARLATESMLTPAACQWIVALYAQTIGHLGRPEQAPTVRIAPDGELPPTTLDAAPTVVVDASPPVLRNDRAVGGLLPTWVRQDGVPGLAVLAASLAAFVLIARARIFVGPNFGSALVWWAAAFAPISVGVFVRAREGSTGASRGIATIWALVAIVLGFTVVVQAADAHRHLISGIGLAASDGFAIAALAATWYHRSHTPWGRLVGAVAAAFVTWLFQRSEVWSLQLPSADDMSHTIAASLVLPIVLIGTSLLSAAVSRSYRPQWTAKA
jgi:hypothetical protein